jgi:hypothetical protein
MRNKQNAIAERKASPGSETPRRKADAIRPCRKETPQWPRLRFAPFVLGQIMSSRRPAKSLLTLHDWEAKHYVLAAVIILVVMGMFAYSWS